MEKVRPQKIQPPEDEFSQFFNEAACHEPVIECRLTPDTQAVLVRLLTAYKRLRAASYRIGYLEGKILRYRRISRSMTANTTVQVVSGDNLRQTGASPRGVSPRATADNLTELEDDTRPWWHTWADGLFGDDRARGYGRGGQRQRQLQSESYYDLIRQSLGTW